MIDLKLLQKDFDFVAKKLQKKQVSKELLEQLKQKTLFFKDSLKIFEDLRAKQNSISKDFGKLKAQNKDIKPLQEELKILKEEVAKAQSNMKKAEDELFKMALNIPNLPDDDVPFARVKRIISR